MKPDEQKFFDQIPENGTVAYDNVRRKLLSTGEIKAARVIHDLRHKKLLYTWTDDNGILLVSRSPRPQG